MSYFLGNIQYFAYPNCVVKQPQFLWILQERLQREQKIVSDKVLQNFKLPDFLTDFLHFAQVNTQQLEILPKAFQICPALLQGLLTHIPV